MMNADILKRAGIDYASGVNRFLNDAELYEMILTAFLEDETMPRARIAYANRDGKTLFERAHEMKGVFGNADLTRLYHAACSLTELLRGGDYRWEEVTPVFLALDAAYDETMRGIREAMRG